MAGFGLHYGTIHQLDGANARMEHLYQIKYQYDWKFMFMLLELRQRVSRFCGESQRAEMSESQPRTPHSASQSSPASFLIRAQT